MMTDTRNRGPVDARPDNDDRFAELVRMVENPTAFTMGRYDAGRDAEPVRSGYDVGAEAFAPNDQAAPEGFELDETLFGLSQPQTPRDTTPNETQAFAPERRDHLHDSAPRAVVLDDFDELIAGEMAALDTRRPVSHGAYAEPFYDDDVRDADEPDYGGDEAFVHDEDAGHRRAMVARSTFASGSLRRRTMFFGGGVAALTLVGMFGAYTLFAAPGSLDGEGGPILIKADAEPVKIAPVDPGGSAVPNQNKAVYERVARGGPAPGPSQEMLITAAEEPIDLSFDDDSDLPGVMVGVSDLPSEIGTEVAALGSQNQVEPVLQPRRVQTFDVRADGTLVPRGSETVAEPASTPAPAAQASADPIAVQTASAPLTTSPAPEPAAAPLSVDELVTSASEVSTVAAPAAGPTEVVPAATASAPPPAEPTQVSALAPAPEATAPAAEPTAAPAGSFFVQISSQPSQELAEQSRQTLSSRYAGPIGGRTMMIQSAEIPDKGTYYRVRVVASSKQEADTVCQSLQSAGGSCFVTR